MNILERLDDYYSLDETEQENILSDIIKIANQDRGKFIAAIQNIHPQDEDHLPVVYEALARDVHNWGSFFIEEAKRILALARQSDKPYQILNILDEFIFIEPEAFRERDQLVDLLKQELENEHPTFRYFAVSLLPDFIREDDKATRELLKERLHDKDWRVRYWAYHNLKDLHDLPSDVKRSLLDQIRSKTSNPLKFD